MAAVAPELKTLGRYNIERTLGKGAMGVVYEGVDPRLGRRVAIKTILKSHLDEETARDYSMRFVREAQAVARLNHPNIVQVYDFGEEGDIAYLVMEFIKGKELKNFFDANERFDLKEAVRVMCELCDALDFAHTAGIIHRDIKPANVMIDAQGRTKLTDFGVARVQDSDKTSVERTQAGTMVGTPAYMSPEQITGGNLDKRTDVFSAGIILYQFLTGEKPFTGSGAWTIAKKIIQEEPPLPSSVNNAISPLFDAVVNKALAKNPEQRFQSARDLAVGLRRALEGKAFEDDSDRTVVGGVGVDFGAVRPAPIVAKAPAQDSARTSNTNTQGNSQEVELEFWRAIKDGNDPDDFELYVQQFPNGIYAKLAKRKIAKLRGVPLDDESTAKAKEQEKKEAEEAARREAEVKAKLEAEKARLEAEMARKEEEYRRREAEAEAKRQAAEQARVEAEERARQEAAAELARREAEYKAREEAEAKAKAEAEARAREEFARREAELQERVAAAEAAPGGKRQAIRYAAIVGIVVLAIAGVVIFALPKEDPEAAAKLKAMQAQLEQAKKKTEELEQAKQREEQARAALEKVRKAEDEARKSGDKTKEKELAEARKVAEAEAKAKADATRAKEQEKLAADLKAKDGDTKKQAVERATQDKALNEKVAAERAAAEKLAAEKLAAEKATAEAKAAADKLALEKAALEAERARIEKAKLASPQPGGLAATSFQMAQGLEGEGKGKDAVKAYIAAARGGSCESAKRLGDIYDKGLIGVSRDYAESLKWYGFARALGTCEVPAPARR
jgi:serine/threonine-protein kinase